MSLRVAASAQITIPGVGTEVVEATRAAVVPSSAEVLGEDLGSLAREIGNAGAELDRALAAVREDAMAQVVEWAKGLQK